MVAVASDSKGWRLLILKPTCLETVRFGTILCNCRLFGLCWMNLLQLLFTVF